jgi:alcohol dehydrogenase (cytochrome c)
MKTIICVISGLLLTAVTGVCPGQTTEQGREFYNDNCARCHGGDAQGGETGPAILPQVSARTDEDLADYIRQGMPVNGMPAFALNDAQMNRLIGYLRAMVPVMMPGPPVVDHRSLNLAEGSVLNGEVLNEGFTDMQIRTEDGRIHLLRKMDGDRYRQVTSQLDWPTYHGDFGGNRFIEAGQINQQNISRLAPVWSFPMASVRQVESTPVVIDGIMYVSNANEVWALDAGTGREIWHYRRPRTADISGLSAMGINRGVAVEGERVFLLTDNAHLIALNKSDGSLLWDTVMADYKENYEGTAAPLTVGGLVISGIGGGDSGARGFVAAYDAATGKEVWRFWTVPLPGEPGAETWIGDAIHHGAGATWMSGTYDRELDIVYWPSGNPGPDYDGDERLGDNLYTNCILALDARTGELKWYYQFTPHDIHDWDAQEPPVLIDTYWQGAPRKLLIQANRNGFYYVLDRTDGELLFARQFLRKLNWAEGIGADGRPILRELALTPTGETYVCPGFQGGTNWYSTAFNPDTGLYYFQALERCNLFSKRKEEWRAGSTYMGGTARSAPGEDFVKSLRAIDIRTGEIKWDLPQANQRTTSSGGVLSTAGGLVFFGENSGHFVAVDAGDGKVLWSYPTNQSWRASPMGYVFDNRQYIAVAVGQIIMAFALME